MLTACTRLLRRRLQTMNERRAAADANSKSISGSRKSSSGGNGSSRGSSSNQQQQQQQPLPQDGVILDSITGVVQLSERVLEAEVFGPVMEQIVVAAAEVEARGREQDKRLTKVRPTRMRPERRMRACVG